MDLTEGVKAHIERTGRLPEWLLDKPGWAMDYGDVRLTFVGMKHRSEGTMRFDHDRDIEAWIVQEMVSNGYVTLTA